MDDVHMAVIAKLGIELESNIQRWLVGCAHRQGLCFQYPLVGWIIAHPGSTCLRPRSTIGRPFDNYTFQCRTGITVICVPLKVN